MEAPFRNVYNRFKLHFYRRVFSAQEARGGLTVMEALAAEVIYALGEPTVGRFAATLGISRPNASYRLRALISKGYIERIPSDGDRRESRLRVTKKFLDSYAINEEYISVLTERITARFTPEEAGLLARLLDILSQELMPEGTLTTNDETKETAI